MSPRLPDVRNDLQIGRISRGCLDCLGFPGRHFVSSSSSSTNTGGKLSSGPFIRRRSKFVDIFEGRSTRPDRTDVVPLRSSVSKLRLMSESRCPRSFLNLFILLPASVVQIPNASASCEVLDDASAGSSGLVNDVCSMLNL